MVNLVEEKLSTTTNEDGFFTVNVKTYTNS